MTRNHQKMCRLCIHVGLGDDAEPCWSCLRDLSNKPHFTGVAEVSQVREPEYTGGSVNYYKVTIRKPTSGGAQYTAECNDVIEALGMNYAEGNIFKAIWRRCAARTLGLQKAGYDEGTYDAEKAIFFGQRLVLQDEISKEGAGIDGE